MRSIVLNWILRCIMYGLGVFCILLLGGLQALIPSHHRLCPYSINVTVSALTMPFIFLVLHYIALNVYISFLERKIARLEINKTKNVEE